MTGDAGKFDTKVNSWLVGAIARRSARCCRDRKISDVIGIGNHANAAAPIKSDVEFARQAIKVAVINNVVMQRLRERTGVNQFRRVNASSRGSRDVANVVHARTAGGKAKF